MHTNISPNIVILYRVPSLSPVCMFSQSMGQSALSVSCTRQAGQAKSDTRIMRFPAAPCEENGLRANDVTFRHILIAHSTWNRDMESQKWSNMHEIATSDTKDKPTL